jgi:hypothetical protein
MCGYADVQIFYDKIKQLITLWHGIRTFAYPHITKALAHPHICRSAHRFSRTKLRAITAFMKNAA